MDLEKLIYRVMGDASSFHKMMEDVKATTKAAAADFQKLGSTITQAIGLPLAAVGGLSTKAFADFDQAMTEAFAKMGRQTPEVRKQMEDVAKALSLSGDVAFSPIELAKAYEELASAGLRAAESMAVLPTVAKFAQAGAFDVGVAVKQLTGAMASFGITTQNTGVAEFSKEMEHFANVITGVANETNASVEGVARSMATDANIAAKRYGMTIEQVGAILGVYAQQNIVGEHAGHMMGRAIRLITSSFVEHHKVWKEAGIDIEAAGGNYIGLADAIGKVEQAFEKLGPAQRTSLLDTLHLRDLSQKAIEPLIGYSKELKRQEKLYQRHGILNEMASIQMESFSNQMKVVRNHLETAGIEIGRTLVPALKTLGEVIKEVINFWRVLPEPLKSSLTYLGAVLAVVGPLTLAISMLGPVLKVATLGLIGFTTALLANPLTWWIAGLTAAGVAIYKTVSQVSGLAQAQKTLNDETQRSIDLDEKMAIAKRKQTENILKKIADVPIIDQQKEQLEKELDIATKHLTTLKKEFETLDNFIKTWQPATIGETLENSFAWLRDPTPVREAKERLKEVDEQFKQTKERILSLEESSKKIGPITNQGISSLVLDSIKRFNTDLEKQIKVLGMSEDQVKAYDLSIQLAGKSVEEFSRTQQLLIDKMEKQQSIDLKKDVDEALKQRAEELLTLGMTARQAEIAIFKFRDALGQSADELIRLRRLDKLLTEGEALEKLKEKAKDLVKELQSPKEKFEETKKELDQMYLKGIIGADTYSKAIRKNIADLNELKNTSIDHVRVNSLAALTLMANWRDQMRLPKVTLPTRPDATTTPYPTTNMLPNFGSSYGSGYGTGRSGGVGGGGDWADTKDSSSILNVLKQIRDKIIESMKQPSVNVKPSNLRTK